MYKKEGTMMRIHLFWIDRKWREKETGYANNYNLIVNFNEKEFKKVEIYR